GLGFALLKFPNLFFDGAWSNQTIGVDGARLADAVRAIDGLSFHSGIPPWVVKNHVTGGREIQAGACRSQAQEEYGSVGIALEALDDGLALFGFASENVRRNLP